MKKRFLSLFALCLVCLLGVTSSAWGGTIPTVLFHETFGDNSGSARTWDDKYSVKSGVAAVYSGVTSYTVYNVKQGKNTTGSTLSGLNQSSSGTDAYIIIGPLNVAAYQSLALTYQWKAASIKGTYTTTLYYATSSTGNYTEVSGTGNGATTFVTRSYDLPVASQVSTLYLKIVWNTSNAQAIIDEVELTGTVSKALTSLAVSGTPTKTEYQAGDTFDPAGLIVTGTYDDKSSETITEGIDWSFTPATLTAGTTSCDVVASVGTVNSPAYTVNGITVTATKTLIGIEAIGTPDEFWKGDTFNHNGITITATWDDESETDVTSECEFSTPDMTTAGEKTVTVTYKDEECSYEINVQTIANTAETAYTVAQIKDIVDAGKDLATPVYVRGTVSQASSSILSGKLNYYISDDGTTTSQQFEFYGNYKASGSTKWTNVTDVQVGDDVIGYGTATLYSGTTYEFSSGNYLVSHIKVTTLSITDITVLQGEAITPAITTNVVGDYTMSYSSNNSSVVSVSGTTLTTGSTGTATITATISANGYKGAETTFDVTVKSGTLVDIAISGDLTKNIYLVGDAFDFSGLTATGIYADESQADITSQVEWSIDPSVLTAGMTSVTVKATKGLLVGSKGYDITVNKKEPAITIADMKISIADKNVAISATTTPADAELTYTITGGSEYIHLNNGIINPLAAGTATVQANYAGNDEYTAANKSFNVTVSLSSTLFYESFDTNNTEGGNDEKWTSGSGALSSDNSGWTFTNGYGANKCARFGTGSKQGSAKTPLISFTGNAKITFKAGAWNGNSENLGLTISATSGTLSQSSVTLTKGEWTEYSIDITGVEGSTQITFAASQSSNNRFFLDEVKVEKPATFTKTISARKMATMYLPYAVTIPSGTKAYIAEADGASAVKLTKITEGQIPANTGVIVYADVDAATDFDFAQVTYTGEQDLSANCLKGVAVKTAYNEVAGYDATNNNYYALMAKDATGVEFQKVSSGSYAANSAYLVLPQSSGVKVSFSFDDDATGIQLINGNDSDNDCIYNLNGMKVDANYKGIVIKNGKKYINK